LLGRRKLVVADKRVKLEHLMQVAELLKLALADVSVRVRLKVLRHGANYYGSRCRCQLRQLLERIVEGPRNPPPFERHANHDGPFRLGVGLDGGFVAFRYQSPPVISL